MGRAPEGGADWLILDALKSGRRTLPAIADYARVEVAAARAALNRQRRLGNVRMYGDKRGARYTFINRRKRRGDLSRCA